MAALSSKSYPPLRLQPSSTVYNHLLRLQAKIALKVGWSIPPENVRLDPGDGRNDLATLPQFIMEAHAEEASKAVKTAEKKLQYALDQKEPDYVQFEALLEKLRVHSGNESLMTYFLTDESAEPTESRLWDAHVKVNGKFKTLLRTFREGLGKKRHVERRKAEKIYLEFIKASQRFYRAYIQRLASNFTGVPKVQEAVRVLHLETLSAQQSKQAGPELRRLLDRSCKHTIIRLGDLSRWRETELSHKERNWGPAIGYYQFALVLDPNDGVCYNQLAVIAQADDNHLNAVYYFHRAAAVEEPSPAAVDNIRRKFDKLLKTGTDGTLGTLDMSDDIVSVLEKRFLAFHAECYGCPSDFVGFSQKATDIVRLIAIGFQETNDQAFDTLLAKICLINITVEHLAKQSSSGSLMQKHLSEPKYAEEAERSRQTLALLQRFNIMTFQTLLKVLSRELHEAETDTRSKASAKDASSISSIARRVLPHLRQYSSWLLSNVANLAHLKFSSSRAAMDQLWQVYVQALNLLLINVDVYSPSQVSYALKEDEDTFAFVPFSRKVKEWRFGTSGGEKLTYDPKIHVKSPDAEAHLRATDLIVDALRYVKHMDDLGIEHSPLSLNRQSFEYHPFPKPEPPQAPSSPSPPKKLWRIKAHNQSASLNGLSLPPTPEPEKSRGQTQNLNRNSTISVPASSVDRSQSTMEDMVSNLVDPSSKLLSVNPTPSAERSSASFHTPSLTTGTPRPTSGQLTAMDLVRQMQRSSMGSQISLQSPKADFNSPNPSIPNIHQTAFTPTAGETATFESRPGTAHNYSPPGSARLLPSSAIFREQMAQQQREFEDRSSPQPSFQPTQSWDTFGQAPKGMDSIFGAFNHHAPISSPYMSQPTQMHSQTTNSPKQGSQTALFGVIGQRRSPSQSSPTRGQAG